MDSGGTKIACVRWGTDPPREAAIIRGKDMPYDTAVGCEKMAEPIDSPFELWTRIRQVSPMCPHWMAHLCHLANTIEPSACGGDAALCQITLTTA